MITIFDGNSMHVKVTVTDDATPPVIKVITGLTITGKVVDPCGTVINAAIIITDGPAGEFTMDFALDAMVIGPWLVSADIVEGINKQTVYTEEVLMKDLLPAEAA